MPAKRAATLAPGTLALAALFTLALLAVALAAAGLAISLRRPAACAPPAPSPHATHAHGPPHPHPRDYPQPPHPRDYPQPLHPRGQPDQPDHALPNAPPRAPAMALDPNLSGSPPGTFPQLGYLVEVAGPQGGGEEGRTTWPLYGAPRATRRDRWLYYTISPAPGGGGIKLPLHLQRRDCMEEVGCEQLTDGDEVSVPDAGVGRATARLYRQA